jgi:hypothetical protein
VVKTNHSATAIAPSKSLLDFSCTNPGCADFGKNHGGNIALYTRYGKNSNRLLVCKKCGITFSEHKKSVLFDCRLPFELVGSVLAALIEGASMRGVSRDCHMSKNTVKRLLYLALIDQKVLWALVQKYMAECKKETPITKVQFDEYLSRQAKRLIAAANGNPQIAPRVSYAAAARQYLKSIGTNA